MAQQIADRKDVDFVLYEQLEADRIALAENGGGILTLEEASMTITILEKT